MSQIILNAVNCGHCGEIFAHKEGVESLTCPYCGFKDDICQFPDYIDQSEPNNTDVIIIKI